MTGDQKKLLSDFETKLRKLMFMYEALKEKNTELQAQLSEKEDKIRIAENEIRSLTFKYENLKVAKFVSVNKHEINTAKTRLTKLVREVDKCIALLNE